MDKEEFAERMGKIALDWDREAKHSAADDLLCAVLTELGYGEGVEIFKAMERWYA